MKAYLTAKWLQFTEWAAWRAWNYARKREIASRARKGLADIAGDDLTADQRRIRANEARQVLENRHFREAWEAMSEYVEAQAESCDPDNKDKAARIVITKQLLRGIRRELERKLEDGYMAEVELVEMQRRNRPLRFVR